MVISGALQNVTAFPVIRKTADEDNGEGDSLMEGGVVVEQEDSPGNQCYILGGGWKVVREVCDGGRQTDE